MTRLVLIVGIMISATCSAGEPRPGYEFQSDDIRSMQDDDFMNPGMLSVDRGRELFDGPAGILDKSCRDCHSKPGDVARRFPKQNAHTGALENLTTQIQHCREAHQQAPPIDYEGEEALALTAYLSNLARGRQWSAVSADLEEDLAAGKRYYERRKGQLDIACNECHGRYAGQRLRGDVISEGHPNAYPVYRLEWQGMGSLHRRLRACDIGVRAEPHRLGSEAYIQLELFLKARSGDLPIAAPGVRR